MPRPIGASSAASALGRVPIGCRHTTSSDGLVGVAAVAGSAAAAPATTSMAASTPPAIHPRIVSMVPHGSLRAMGRSPVPTWYFALVVVRQGHRFLLTQEKKYGSTWSV